MAKKSDEQAISGVCARLEDGDKYVREAAVRALAQVAEKGDERAISGTCARLEHANHDVREAAVKALVNVAGKEPVMVGPLGGGCDQCQCMLSVRNVEKAVASLASTSVAVLHLTHCDLGRNIAPFAVALSTKQSVIALDLRSVSMNSSDAMKIIQALEGNMTMTTLCLPRNVYLTRDAREQIVAALDNNRAGVQVLTLDFLQKSPAKVDVMFRLLSNKKLATVEASLTDDLCRLRQKLMKQIDQSGHLAFVSTSGSLIAGPNVFPPFQLGHVQSALSLEQAERHGDTETKKAAACTLATVIVSHITNKMLEISTF